MKWIKLIRAAAAGAAVYLFMVAPMATLLLSVAAIALALWLEQTYVDDPGICTLICVVVANNTLCCFLGLFSQIYGNPIVILLACILATILEYKIMSVRASRKKQYKTEDSRRVKGSAMNMHYDYHTGTWVTDK